MQEATDDLERKDPYIFPGFLNHLRTRRSTLTHMNILNGNTYNFKATKPIFFELPVLSPLAKDCNPSST